MKGLAAMARSKDPAHEERIIQEIIVDCYDPEKQSYELMLDSDSEVC